MKRQVPFQILYKRSIAFSCHLFSSSLASSHVSLSYHGPVALIKMQNGENRFTHKFLKDFLDSLNQIESNQNIKALITTGEGKFYSNRLDLNNFLNCTPEQIDKIFNVDMRNILKKLLTFPLTTIAAINGHCYGVGGPLALSHDYRIMREDESWFCLPELHTKMSFSVALMEIVKASAPPDLSIIFGKKYSAQEGQVAGIIHECISQDRLIERALDLGSGCQLSSQQEIDHEVWKEMKLAFKYAAVKALSEP